MCVNLSDKLSICLYVGIASFSLSYFQLSVEIFICQSAGQCNCLCVNLSHCLSVSLALSACKTVYPSVSTTFICQLEVFLLVFYHFNMTIGESVSLFVCQYVLLTVCLSNYLLVFNYVCFNCLLTTAYLVLSYC